MFEKGDSSNKQKMNGCFFGSFTAKFEMFFVLTK